MRYLFVFAILLAACNQSNTLEEKEQTLELTRHYIDCACANWITIEDIRNYGDRGDEIMDHYMYIEPADPSLILPDSIGHDGDWIKFTGHFYKAKGVPKDFGFEERNPDKARILRYTSYELIRRDSSRFLPKSNL